MTDVMDVEQKNEKEIEIPDSMPVLPVRDIVVFPYMILPLFVGREMSIKAIEHALGSNRMVLLLTQKDLNIETPAPEDLFSIGTVALVMRMLKLPDGRVTLF
jgi:ATP-dependent Lon protease